VEELRSFLEGLGFSIPSDKFVLDSKPHRFPRGKSKDSAWFIGHLYNYTRRDGQYCVATFGDWTTGEEHQYKPGNLTPGDKKSFEEQIKKDRKIIEEQRTSLNIEAAKKAKEAYEKALTVGRHSYLDRKKIDALYGARLSGDILLIPMQTIKGEIVGGQRITPTGDKFFFKGQKTDGCFFVIGDLSDDIFICEGYATGCSIHMATKKNVVVAFNAGNLHKVAGAIRLARPDIKITIAGDDDKSKTPNIGREKAEKAGTAAMASVIFPECEGTDFNDMHCEAGLEAVMKRLATEVEMKTGFKALGYDDIGYHFFCLDTMDMKRITTFSPTTLFHLAPEQYWNEQYRIGGETKTSYLRAANDLIQACKAKGPFDANLIRGLGVWLDRGRTVVNTGSSLIVNSKDRGLYWPDGDYIYVQSSKKMAKINEIATIDECKILLDACSVLNWANDNSAHYVAGWIAVARVAGALPIRPHLWLTGSQQAGKSTVLNGIIKKGLGGAKACLSVQGASTEAGIRQTFKNISLPLVFDEFEINSTASQSRSDLILELCRSTWSTTDGVILKGSAGGQSLSFNVSFSALVTGINVGFPSEADQSRFTVVELKPHGDCNEQKRRALTAIKKITVELGNKIFARTISMLPILLESYEILHEEIAAQSSQRAGQQLGMIMAGWWILQSDEVITREQAEAVASELGVKQENRSHLNENQSCLDHLLEIVVTLNESGIGSMTRSIKSIVLGDNHFHKDEIQKYGIIVKSDAILVGTAHSFLKEKFKSTPWIKYGALLSRYIRDAHNVKIDNRDNDRVVFKNESDKPSQRQRTVRIPLQLIK
jgi:putative DNA primase/helicase